MSEKDGMREWACPVCKVPGWRTVWSPVGLWEECRCGRMGYVFAADLSGDPNSAPRPLPRKARAVARELGALRVLEPRVEPASAQDRRRGRWDGYRTAQDLMRAIARRDGLGDTR